MRLRLEQIEQTTGCKSGDAEHQMAEYLEVAADTQMTAAVVGTSYPLTRSFSGERR